MVGEQKIEMRVDPNRRGIGETGIYIRAKDVSGKWEVVDIAELDKESLLSFLTSRGGSNRWAENTVGILLGHGHLHPLTHVLGFIVGAFSASWYWLEEIEGEK